jgi:hypothetical protein
VSERPQEGAAHVVAVTDPGLASNNIDEMTALLHKVPRLLDPQIFARIGRPLTRLGVESPAELPWAEMSRISELGDR